MNTRNPLQGPSDDPLAPEVLHRHACALIHSMRTMVLATQDHQGPWAAPVYYVYVEPSFCFFSSPNARHVQRTQPDDLVAAAIFADSDQWQEIQGLQMSGHLREISKRTDQLRSIGRFLARFPFAVPFLRPSKSESADVVPEVAEKVRIYAFTPQESYYVNNHLAFGKRLPVELRRRKK